MLIFIYRYPDNPGACTLEDFKKYPLYDGNFDISGMQASYPGGRQVKVGCNVGYSGFFKLLCVEGKWQHRGTNCQRKLTFTYEYHLFPV